MKLKITLTDFNCAKISLTSFSAIIVKLFEINLKKKHVNQFELQILKLANTKFRF